MPRSALTGSRIRARRLDLGMRQVQLADACGISASYLNLIEHNRRRIGGKLLVDIARTLDVEVSALSEGADETLLGALRSAATTVGDDDTAERAEEFAGRFPDWARVVSRQAQRIAALEQAVETLSDRIAHDPFLSASLHDILSTAAAIRSTSAILAEEQDVDPAWQARFHRNLHEDSRRLADASRALASYLDAGGDTSKVVLSPQEEFQGWLEEIDFRLDAIDAGQAGGDDGALAVDALGSDASRVLAREFVAQYRLDAARMPRDEVRAALEEHGPDPARLAALFDVGYPTVFRRIAALASVCGLPSVGLVVCDGSGTLIFRKPAEGFPLPLFGSACPLWPLFQALSRPATPMKTLLELAGRTPRRFVGYSFADPSRPEGFDGPQLVQSYMLLLPAATEEAASAPTLVGTSCRICPRADCVARRELSVIGGSR
jgi:transcriptional regulator with XRE-family HTH domain